MKHSYSNPCAVHRFMSYSSRGEADVLPSALLLLGKGWTTLFLLQAHTQHLCLCCSFYGQMSLTRTNIYLERKLYLLFESYISMEINDHTLDKRLVNFKNSKKIIINCVK